VGNTRGVVKVQVVTMGPISVNRRALLEYGAKMGKENIRRVLDDARRWNRAVANRQPLEPVNIMSMANKNDDDDTSNTNTNTDKNDDKANKNVISNKFKTLQEERRKEKTLVATSTAKGCTTTKVGSASWDHDTYFEKKGPAYLKERRQKIVLLQEKLRDLESKVSKGKAT
jgi:hypothetical protein